jgi:hypothetical protein
MQRFRRNQSKPSPLGALPDDSSGKDCQTCLSRYDHVAHLGELRRSSNVNFDVDHECVFRGASMPGKTLAGPRRRPTLTQLPATSSRATE